jgi:SAM-dependent methyltransferase
MPSYSVFAPFYDAAMGDMSDKVSFLKKLLRDYAPEAETLLELACGTGSIMSQLAGSYQVSGLDISPDMLAIAKQKLPQSQFHQGDMADFKLRQTFDVVLCVFDSVNHLLQWHEWQSMFQSVYGHLNDKGLFVFDINTPRRLEWLADSPAFSKQLGEDYMVMDVQRADQSYNWEVKIFQHEKGDRYVLREEVIPEVSFPVEDVQAALSELFTVEAVVDVRNLESADPNWRPFFICRKK